MCSSTLSCFAKEPDIGIVTRETVTELLQRFVCFDMQVSGITMLISSYNSSTSYSLSDSCMCFAATNSISIKRSTFKGLLRTCDSVLVTIITHRKQRHWHSEKGKSKDFAYKVVITNFFCFC